MSISRRDFLQLSSAGLITLACPFTGMSFSKPSQKKYLFLIELSGGNDGINTLIPLSQFNEIKKMRPNSFLNETLFKNTFYSNSGQEIAFNPYLSDLASLHSQGNLIPILGIGVKDSQSSLSHFHQIKTWEKGSSVHSHQGWISEVHNHFQLNHTGPLGTVLGSNEHGVLSGQENKSLVINQLQSFLKFQKQIKELPPQHMDPKLRELNKFIADLDLSFDSLSDLNKVEFNDTKFSQDIKTALSLISNKETHIPVFKIKTGGFDTHKELLTRHQGLMTNLNDGLKSLVDGLKALGIFEDSLIMTYSEFGRRAYENNSNGNDHGTSGVQFLIGGSLSKKVFGHYPDITKWDKRKNIETNLDFRKIYASILNDFLEVDLMTSTPLIADRYHLLKEYYDNTYSLT